jgi:hypothetical protein
MIVAAAVVAAPVAINDSGASIDRSAVTVGDYIRDRAQPGETVYVLYAKADILYYAGLRPAFPYNWSLMMEAAPHAETKLRRDLASPHRPTWLVEWQHTTAFGLDRSGLTRRLVARHYRVVANLCGHSVYIARGAAERAAPVDYQSCDPSSASPFVS